VNDIVFLATAPNEPIARLWEQILAESGIRALVQPGGPGFGAWGSVATFSHDLFVLASDLERAQAVLQGLEDEE
jgi:hypothetical protein